MSGSSGGSTVTQKNNTEPWTGIQPQLSQVGSEAQRLYNTGVGPSYYPGATTVGPTLNEVAGQTRVQNIAANGSGLSQGLLNNLQGPLQNIIDGSDKINVGNAFNGNSSLQNPLMNIINGRDQVDVPEVGNNPYVMPTLDYAANRAGDSVNSAFSGLGRYGAPEHSGALGREVGNIYSTGLRDQMNTDIERRMQAQGTNIANRANAVGQFAGLSGNDLDRQMQAQSGNIANRAGAISAYGGLASGAEDSRYWDANKMIGLGAAQREDLQTELQSNIDRYNANQARPWDQLNLYNNMVSGLGGMGSSQTSTVPRGSPLLGLLGGAAAGAGVGGAMLPGVGALPGGILGGLGGLFL